MELRENIIVDGYLKSKMDAGTLGLSDYLLIALAKCCAGLLPAAAVYIGAQQQAVVAPALFVDFYSITAQRRLEATQGHEFGIEITYVPEDELSRAELAGAIHTIQRGVHRLPSPAGEWRCYRMDSDITDGLAHVTGLVLALEAELPDDLIIEHAEKELKI